MPASTVSPSLAARLKLLCLQRVAAALPAPVHHVLLRESGDDGAAEVRAILPANTKFARAVTVSGGKEFQILRDRQNCDGGIVYLTADGTWRAVLIELKHKATTGTLAKARDQLRASIVRMRMVLDLLEIRQVEWHAVMVYGRDQLSAATDPDPAMRHRRVGPGAALGISQRSDPISVDELTVSAAFRREHLPITDSVKILRGDVVLPG